MQGSQKTSMNRRKFLGSAATSTALTLGASPLLKASRDVPAGPALKAGLIGCGGRGTGAVMDLLESAPNIRITALADLFQDKIDATRKKLQDRDQTVSDQRCLLGFDAHQKLLDSDIDLVLIATPPHFRPSHLAAAVAANKHVFMEKPAAVDPWGIRSILASSQKAEKKGLCIVAGTQRRHQFPYIETQKRVADGAIGKIVSARCHWMQGQLWYRSQKPGWSDMEWMIRDWVNWSWLSGDHIVEQHVHNLDVIHWFTGEVAQSASGAGGRLRRITGNQYDFFEVDYSFPDGVHLHSRCRQINGCHNDVSEMVVGTQGYTNCLDTIYDRDGNVSWVYEGPKPRAYVQEHTDLVTAIRSEKPINEARQIAESTLTAIMGRISAYSGKKVSREEVLQMNLRLGPSEYDLGPLAADPIPIAGAPGGPPKPV